MENDDRDIKISEAAQRVVARWKTRQEEIEKLSPEQQEELRIRAKMRLIQRLRDHDRFRARSWEQSAHKVII